MSTDASKSKPPTATEYALSKDPVRWSNPFYFVCGVLPIVGAYTALVLFLTVDGDVPEPSDADAPDIISPFIPVFVVCILVELAISLAQGRKLYRLNDSMSSLFAGVLSRLVSMGERALAVYPYAYVYKHWRLATFDRDSWLATALIFLLVDYGYYVFHRLGHEWNPGWATHITHHNSEEYNLTTALRQGALQNFFSWPYAMLGAYAGVPIELALVHSQVNTLYQFWIHTRLVTRLPAPLEWVLNTPSHHRVHHGRQAWCIDVNFGGILIVWDRAHGTFEPEHDDEEVLYGVTSALSSWSPVEAQLHHWDEMFATARQTDGWLAKLGVFTVLGPAFNFHIKHHSVEVAPDCRRVRLDANTQYWAHTVYAVAHLVIVIGLLDSLMGAHNADTISTSARVGWSALILAQTTGVMALLGPATSRKLAFELVRVAACVGWLLGASGARWMRDNERVSALMWANVALVPLLLWPAVALSALSHDDRKRD